MDVTRLTKILNRPGKYIYTTTRQDRWTNEVNTTEEEKDFHKDELLRWVLLRDSKPEDILSFCEDYMRDNPGSGLENTIVNWHFVRPGYGGSNYPKGWYTTGLGLKEGKFGVCRFTGNIGVRGVPGTYPSKELMAEVEQEIYRIHEEATQAELEARLEREAREAKQQALQSGVLQRGTQMTYLEHGENYVLFQVGDRTLRISGGAMVGYNDDDYEPWVSFHVEGE